VAAIERWMGRGSKRGIAGGGTSMRGVAKGQGSRRGVAGGGTAREG